MIRKMSSELQNGQENAATAVENLKNLDMNRQTHEELIKIVEELELIQRQDKLKIGLLEEEIKASLAEKNDLKSGCAKLENDLVEAKKSQNLVDSQEVQVIKEQSEELLVRAKGIIFEKTKVCKNQELQIEALSQQVASLKEVVAITKDLLDIRNMEVRHLQERLDGMEQKFNLDRQKHEIMNKKMDRMMEMNTDLKREYETQLVLFNALRERYSERELARDILNGDSNQN